MSEAFAELQNRDEINRQLKAKTEEDDRLHTEQTISILHQGEAETARLRSHLVQDGEQSRSIIKSTRAQTSTPLTERASQRTKMNDLTVQHQTAIQQRGAVATTAQLDVDNIRHELRPWTDHIVAPDCGEEGLLQTGSGERPPRPQDKKHLCRVQFQQQAIRLRRSCHLGLQIQGNQQPKPMLEGHQR